MTSCPITSLQIEGGKVETVVDFIFLGSKITADGDHSHETQGHLLFGRKAMTNLDSILKNRNITFPYSQSYGFSSSHVRMRAGPQRRLSAEELMLLNCGAGEES